MNAVAKPLNPRAFRFVDEYIRCGSGPMAAMRCGYSEGYAQRVAAELLDDPRVQTAIAERQRMIADLANVDAAWVLQQWVQLASADPTRVVKLRRLCCRYCHGAGHAYQWTPREFAEHAAKAMTEGLPPPSPDGGLAYDRLKDPHPNCPECRGEGVEDLHIEDMRFLTGPERLLVAGVKQTREGIEVKFRDQDGALRLIAEHLGMLVKRAELTGRNGQPLIPGKLPMVEEILPDDPKALENMYRDITSV